MKTTSFLGEIFNLRSLLSKITQHYDRFAELNKMGLIVAALHRYAHQIIMLR